MLDFSMPDTLLSWKISPCEKGLVAPISLSPSQAYMFMEESGEVAIVRSSDVYGHYYADSPFIIASPVAPGPPQITAGAVEAPS